MPSPNGGRSFIVAIRTRLWKAPDKILHTWYMSNDCSLFNAVKAVKCYHTLSDIKNATVGFYLVSEKLINHTTPIFISCMVYHSYTTCQNFKKIYRLVFEKKWFNKKRFKTSFHIKLRTFITTIYIETHIASSSYRQH